MPHYNSINEDPNGNCQHTSVSALDDPDWKPEELNAERTKLKKPQSFKHRIIFILSISAFFLEGCAISLMGPFYPSEATDRGVSTFLIFAVFGIFELLKFILSPLYGKYLSALGPKTVLLCGVLVGGVSNIAFGTLGDMFESGTYFISFSFLFRSLEAVGYCGFITALCAIVTTMFPDRVVTSFSFLEAANGVGLMIGPAIGGGLYEVAGFGLPFYIVGGLVMINGCVLYAIIDTVPNEVKEKKCHSILTVIRHPLAFMALSSMLTGSLSDSFMEPTLSVYLKPFKYSTAVIGLFFVLYCGTYTLSCPILGFLSDKFCIQNKLIVGGHDGVTALGFLLLGSSSSPAAMFEFIPFNLSIVLVGIVLTGASVGCMTIPTFKCFVNGIKEIGLEDNLNVLALITGISNGVYCLGGFLGATLGGVLVSQMGYPMSYLVVGLLHIVMSIAAALLFKCHRNGFFATRNVTSNCSKCVRIG